MTIGNKTTAYQYNKNDELLRTDTLHTDTEKNDVVIYKNDKNGNQLATVNRSEIPAEAKDTSYIDVDVTLGDNQLNDNVVNHYNALNQLTETLTKNYKVSFTYDAEGLRTGKTVNGEKTVYVWDGDQVVMELSKGGAVQKRYIRGNDLVYADKGENTEKTYYVTDMHGNVVQLLDESGNVTKTYEYDSFGNEVKPEKKDENPYRYCGEYYDKETEEVYLRARYYQPSVGRFITRDTYTGESDEPLSLHLYTYCYNNPVDYLDDSGNCPIVDWGKFVWRCITGSITNKKANSTNGFPIMQKPISPKMGKGAIGKKKLDVTKLKPSKKIKKIIKQYEGYYNYMYDSQRPDNKELRKKYKADDGLDWTIGWGHKIFGEEGNKYKKNTISKVKAQQLFDLDLSKVTEGSLHKYLKKYNVKLFQYQYDALVCFTYNLGYNFWNNESDKNRTIYKLIKSKKYSDKAYVKKVFCLYKNPNLLLRRKKEAKIFNLGKYPKN